MREYIDPTIGVTTLLGATMTVMVGARDEKTQEAILLS
jgi:hypothetical protein